MKSMKLHLSCSLSFITLLSSLNVISQTNKETTPNSIEASGITGYGDYVIFVTDNQPGAYFKYGPVAKGTTQFLLEGDKLSLVKFPGAELAYDLEEIDVLGDGRIVLLSERLRMLIGESGVITHYEDQLAEVGGKGLEGLAVRSEGSTNVIAVLWEGGYFEYDNIPLPLTKTYSEDSLRKSFYPLVFVHNLSFKSSSSKKIGMTKDVKTISLLTPRDSLEPKAQRYRAPDLVWYKMSENEWGFIVLLNSNDSPHGKDPQFAYSVLQKYNMNGVPVGKPIDLKKIINEPLKNANWEGLGWFKDQKILVLVHDKRPIMGTPTAVLLDIEKLWPSAKTTK